jgi:hypothetical protein
VCKDENYLFFIKEEGTFKDFFESSSREEKTDIIETIFEGLIGTCFGSLESKLDEYGLSLEILKGYGFTEDFICTLFDETVDTCPICEWWIESGSSDNCTNEDEDICGDCGELFENCVCDEEEDEDE